MPQLAFTSVLFALIAVAIAQNTRAVDDFVAVVPTQPSVLRISSYDTQTVSAFNCDSSAGGSVGTILGGCHVLSLTGFASSGTEPSGWISHGNMHCNNFFTCAAECVLKLDGNNETTPAISRGLNVDLNSLGYAFRLYAATDVGTTFTIRVYDNSTGVSVHSAAIPTGSSVFGFVQFDFNFADFSGNASFSKVGAIELVVPGNFDTFVTLSDWHILSSEASIYGSVFSDHYCDLIKDAGDSGIGNIEVTLTGDSSCPVSSLTATTSSAGDYSFIGVPSCTYIVSIPSEFVGRLCSTSGVSLSVAVGSTSVFNVNFAFQGDVSDIFTVPADAAVFCNEGRSPSTLGRATSSSKGRSNAVSYSDSIWYTNCDADFTLARTWTDSAGNSGTQMITVMDTGVAPTFTNANSTTLDITVECNACIDAYRCIVALEAVDDCSSVTMAYVDNYRITSHDSASCNPLVVRTWTAVDDCGNTAASQAQHIFEDCS